MMAEKILLLPAGRPEERKVSPWLVGGIALGVVGIAATLVYALARAAAAAPPPGGKFGYYNIICSSPWDPTGSYPIYDIECDVINEGDVRETRTIQLWAFLYLAVDEWYKQNEVEVTLDPGETYHYHFRGGYISPDYLYPVEVLVTDNYFEWEWPGGKRRPYKGDSSGYCSFTPGEAGWG